MFDRLVRIWNILTADLCTHHWRPALGKSKPVRYCDLCGQQEELTVEAFYSQFGKMPHKWEDGPMGKQK